MTDSRTLINSALDLAASGAIEDACERLWPLVRQTEGREEALFSMACCFERVGQLPPAAYLFGWIAGRYPDFEPAHERLGRCRQLMAERGLHEDFSDSGHIACPSCTLRYRAELPVCPYCGGKMEETGTDVVAAATHAETTPPTGDVLDQIGRDLDRTWKTVQSKFNEFTAREDLSGTARRVQELAREAKARTQAFAESEAARDVKKKLGEFGSEASKRVREIAKNEKVQSVARQTKELGEEAISRVKAVASSDDAKDARSRLEEAGHETVERVESWAKSDEVQSTWQNLYRGAESFVAAIQRRIDRITGRKPEEPNS